MKRCSAYDLCTRLCNYERHCSIYLISYSKITVLYSCSFMNLPMSIKIPILPVSHLEGRRCCLYHISMGVDATCITSRWASMLPVSHLEGRRCCLYHISMGVDATCITSRWASMLPVSHLEGRRCCLCHISKGVFS